MYCYRQIFQSGIDRLVVLRMPCTTSSYNCLSESGYFINILHHVNYGHTEIIDEANYSEISRAGVDLLRSIAVGSLRKQH